MVVHLRLYEELNDFLPADRRKRRLPDDLQSIEATTGELLDDLGVPRSLVELVVLNGEIVLTRDPAPLQSFGRSPLYHIHEANPGRQLIKLLSRLHLFSSVFALSRRRVFTKAVTLARYVIRG